MGIMGTANFMNGAVSARELQKAGQRREAGITAGDRARDTMLLDLIEAQRKTNRMLWALLSDEQRAALGPDF